MFLGYGGDKEFDVKSYVDASLTPIRIALSRDTGYVQWGNNLEQLQVEQLFEMAPNIVQQLHLQDDIEICEVHTDLKDSDPLTNNHSHKRDMINPMGVEFITITQ